MGFNDRWLAIFTKKKRKISSKGEEEKKKKHFKENREYLRHGSYYVNENNEGIDWKTGSTLKYHSIIITLHLFKRNSTGNRS